MRGGVASGHVSGTPRLTSICPSRCLNADLASQRVASPHRRLIREGAWCTWLERILPLAVIVRFGPKSRSRSWIGLISSYLLFAGGMSRAGGTHLLEYGGTGLVEPVQFMLFNDCILLTKPRTGDRSEPCL